MLDAKLTPMRLISLYHDMRKLPLRDLVDLHYRTQSADSQADLFCDGYLLAENFLYRRIRTLIRRQGYRLSSETGIQTLTYRAFPLAGLDDIFTYRTVPYTNSIMGLERLLERRSDCQISMPFLVTSLRKNPVMHESAHVAWDLTTPTTWGFTGARAAQEDAFFSSLMAEAFANSTEVLFAMSCRTVMGLLGVHHTSYVGNYRLEAKQELDSLGEPEAVHAVMMVGYLMSNLMLEPPTPAEFALITEAFFPGGVPEAQQKPLRHWCEMGFGLSESFRTLTTRHYCHFQGWDEEYESLVKLKFLADPDLRERVFAAIRQALQSIYRENEDVHLTGNHLAIPAGPLPVAARVALAR